MYKPKEFTSYYKYYWRQNNGIFFKIKKKFPWWEEFWCLRFESWWSSLQFFGVIRNSHFIKKKSNSPKHTVVACDHYVDVT